MKEMIKLVPMELTIMDLISHIVIWILSIVAVILVVKILKDCNKSTH